MGKQGGEVSVGVENEDTGRMRIFAETGKERAAEGQEKDR